MTYVNRTRWQVEVATPDWYLRLREEYEALLGQARTSPRPLAKAIADEVYSFFEDALRNGTVALGETGPDWDRERRPIDTAVIHHTVLPAGITRERVEAIHLTRIYARYYSDPLPAEAAIRGTPIFSGHFRGKRQVFYGYHWLVRQDGEIERLLEDHETGWHAGNWDVNCRSIGISLDGDFREAPPASAMVATVIELLQTHYPTITGERVFGHCEINPNTTCPGATFVADWKRTLISDL